MHSDIIETDDDNSYNQKKLLESIPNEIGRPFKVFFGKKYFFIKTYKMYIGH